MTRRQGIDSYDYRALTPANKAEFDAWAITVDTLFAKTWQSFYLNDDTKTITVHRYLLNDHGDKYVTGRGAAARAAAETVTIATVTPPPVTVDHADWALER